ncbi:MAG: hypothetical protein FJ096_11510 [Deltaproteobacteria bacterium]|nr:hypothetical protein [Deltaproteobacteria bacterium]
MRVLRLAPCLGLVLLACSRPGPADTKATPSAPPPVPVSASTAAPARTDAREKQLLAPVYHVDRIYKSMTGPQTTEEFRLVDGAKPELLWIVGFEAVMVGADGKTPASQEWMCHSNLDLEPVSHGKIFGGSKSLSGRLFTLSQGQSRIDLPARTGIPVVSTEALSLNTQVLNLNMDKGTVDVRHLVTVRFVRDAELTEPFRALYPAAAYGLKLLRGKDGVFGGEADPMAGHGGHEHGGSCLPGQNAGTNEFDDGKGRAFTGHWVVKPGHEENQTRVTDIMNLPFDTTLHYVAVHLHPFAESLELRDLTDDRVVYRATTRQASKGVGLEHVDFFSSEGGVPLQKGHEYGMTSVYENTSGKDQDSMAVMNLYLHDREFKKPDLAALPASPAPTEPVRRQGGSMM